MHLKTSSFLFFVFLFSCESPEPFAEAIPYTGPDITFGIIGDYGDQDGKVAEVAELVKSWNPEFIITLGDNNYADGKFETIKNNISIHYCDYIYNPDAPDSLRCEGLANDLQENLFFPSLGNHDFDNPLLDQPYQSFFTLPGDERTYDFVKGPIHFFVLNSELDPLGEFYSPNQDDWLDEKSRKSTSPFKLSYFHHSPYSRSSHSNSAHMQFDFFDMDIDLVLTGHNHVYETFKPKTVDETTYLVNGLGGRSTLNPCGLWPYDSDRFDYYCYNDYHGAVKAKASADSIIFQLYSINEPSQVLDELIIHSR